jgi:chromate transporter
VLDVSRPRPTVRQLAWLTARDVTRTLGGGIAAIEVLRRSLAARGWIDDSAHGMIVAVSRLTPGTNILAYCTALGWYFDRLRGSLTAVVAASVPSAVAIAVVSAAVVRFDRYRSVRAVLAAGAIVAAALVLSSAWHLLRPYVAPSHRTRTALIVIVAAALFAAEMSPVRILLLAAILGFVLPPRGAV